jgi:hypothetical protein
MSRTNDTDLVPRGGRGRPIPFKPPVKDTP